MTTSNGSLSQFALRRFKHAGGWLLADFDPFFVPVDAARDACRASGKDWLSLAHYDYLDLAQHPAVEAAGIAAASQYGTGVGASRLVGGERVVHRELEDALSQFIGAPAALALVSGYATNASLLGHLLTSGDLILYDASAHNSIMAGKELSRSASMAFRHNDLEHLEHLLREHRSAHGRVLVIVEGLYSMDGDIVDLPRVVEICRRYDAWVMVDEAHSIGVLGSRGRGITEHFGMAATDVDIIVGTMSKAFAHSGGFICAGEDVIKWLKYTLPGFVYSVGLTPQIAAGVTAAIGVARAEPERVERLQEISRYFLAAAKQSGLDVGDAIGAGVIPVMMPSSQAAIAVSASLLEQGIFLPPIVQIGVPKDKPRLRVFMSAAHTRADVDRAVGAVKQCLTEVEDDPLQKDVLRSAAG